LPPGVYGVGVWARQQGSTATYEAYYIATLTLTSSLCTSASLAPDFASPQGPGAHVTFTTTTANCPTALYRYWLLPPGGSWTIVRDWQTVSTWAWDTTGYKAGTYQVGVWAEFNGPVNGYDAYGIATYTLGTASCTSASMSPDVGPPQLSGAAVTFTASSNGCGSPQYQFWVLPPGGGWTVAQPYGASTTLAWNTAGLAPGTYQVGVWAKQSGSTARYDAYFISTYRLVIASCASANLSASPDSPQLAGTSVTFTATSTGCGAPAYKFWILPANSSTWTVIQPYGAGNTLVWDTSGLAPGPYRLGVWARQTGSPNSYDTYAIVTYWVGT
jgi:hypothetical protein